MPLEALVFETVASLVAGDVVLLLLGSVVLEGDSLFELDTSLAEESELPLRLSPVLEDSLGGLSKVATADESRLLGIVAAPLEVSEAVTPDASLEAHANSTATGDDTSQTTQNDVRTRSNR